MPIAASLSLDRWKTKPHLRIIDILPHVQHKIFPQISETRRMDYINYVFIELFQWWIRSEYDPFITDFPIFVNVDHIHIFDFHKT